ncbi:MAG: hypothetical protein ABEJ64_00890 [Candidatus Nanohaloarchaea archaeon]
MRLKNRLALLAASLTTVISTVVAHSEQDQGYYGPGMMWSDGGWMHNTGHMIGYNMWGMGWFGVLFGLAFWVLVILGIIYLYQQITENEEEQDDG